MNPPGEQSGTEPRRLYKSRRDKMIDGVCGGIAEYLNVDPTIIRLVFVVLAFLGGTGVVLYLAGMILMPVNPAHLSVGVEGYQRREKNSGLLWGSILVVLGIVLLLSNLGVFAFYRVWEMSWGIVFAVLLILIGLAIISRERRLRQPTLKESEVHSEEVRQDTRQTELRRSRRNRKIFGVCGGLGDYFQVDPTVIRILFVIIGLASLGLAVLVYLLLAILMPEEQLSQAAGEGGTRQ